MSGGKINVDVGTVAPEFTLGTTMGQVSLADYRGRQNVVLFFLREFSCVFCQRHAGNLVRLYPRLQARNTSVLIIGGGELVQAERMGQRLNLPFPVAADLDHSIYQKYGLDKALGFIQRSAIILVDQQGIIRYLNRVINPSAALDETALMTAVEQLAGQPVQMEAA